MRNMRGWPISKKLDRRKLKNSRKERDNSNECNRKKSNKDSAANCPSRTSPFLAKSYVSPSAALMGQISLAHFLLHKKCSYCSTGLRPTKRSNYKTTRSDNLRLCTRTPRPRLVPKRTSCLKKCLIANRKSCLLGNCDGVARKWFVCLSILVWV